ncbi:hypothetical protein K2173_027555 [Erythroxylum novogranatense]|uniref:EF-hand domain-containing protein n=1 Tax=Erythroxylum novogranatense TaxID=1862640 RepID=A0AAV8TZP0_9ROSI|nr:hypothetical protein K2173_027555 [Erythroxylum novogranatense]
MPVKSAPVVIHGMTIEQFKEWLLKTYDVDHDGKISREELAEAIRAAGGWFAGWKGKRGVRRADQNHNGYIDPSELDSNNFKRFAEKHLGVKIYDH